MLIWYEYAEIEYPYFIEVNIDIKSFFQSDFDERISLNIRLKHLYMMSKR